MNRLLAFLLFAVVLGYVALAVVFVALALASTRFAVRRPKERAP